MMADKKSFVLYCDYKQHFSLLSPEDQGRLLMAIFSYVETGEEPELDAMPLMAFSFIRAQIDRDKASYRQTCKRRSEAGKKSGESRRAKAEENAQEETQQTNVRCDEQKERKETKRSDNDTDNDNENDNENDTLLNKRGNSKELPRKKQDRFSPPTVEDVRAYCIERQNNVNPEAFVDFYASKGWMVGKNKMRDWKAAVRTWENGESRQQPQRPVKQAKSYSNPALDYYHQLMEQEKGGEIYESG